MRVRTLIAAAVALASVVGLAACNPKQPSSDSYAVVGVLDSQSIADTPLSLPNLPAQPNVEQVRQFAMLATRDVQTRWREYLASLGVASGVWQVRLVTSNDQPPKTVCTERNNVENEPDVVHAALTDPFYCPEDGANGTLYVPIEALRARWLAAGFAPALAVQVFYIWLAALAGDAYSVGVEQLALQHPGLPPTARPADTSRFVKGLTLGFCMAGTMAAAVGFTAPAVIRAGQLRRTDVNGSAQAGFGEQLMVGFNTRQPGACVSHYWNA